jgi:hypothetical protein
VRLTDVGAHASGWMPVRASRDKIVNETCAEGIRVAEPGEFEVLVGSSFADIRARATFELTD